MTGITDAAIYINGHVRKRGGFQVAGGCPPAFFVGGGVWRCKTNARFLWTKPAAKAVDPAALPVPEKLMAELRELGVPADAKPARFEQTGTLTQVAGSQARATDHALMFESENRGFVVPIADGILRKEFVDQPVRVVGRAYRIPTWKAPIVVVESIARP